MRIDAHHHLWDLAAVRYPWLMARGETRFFGDPSAIQRDYLLAEFRDDAAGFGGSVHIQVGAADPMAEAEWIQKVADTSPDWPLVQVPFCDLTAADPGKCLGRLRALPSVRGVRQIVGRAPGEDAVTGTGALLDDPRFAHGLGEAATWGLSFDLQLLPEQYARMARVLDEVPDMPVALCHAGSPHDRTAQGLRDWARRLHVLSSRPQITCKLSGLGMFDPGWTPESLEPIVGTLLEQFGPTRLMFGSNFPVDSLYSDYAHLLAAMESLVPVAAHAAVFGGTAQRFYRID